MKTIVKKLALFVLPALMLYSCNKKQAPSASPASPSVTVSATPNNEGARTEAKNTLSYFKAEAKANNYALTLAPENYTPKKLGIWTYDQVYIYDQKDGNPFELYTFTDQDALKFAVAGNTLDLWEDKGEVHCSGAGSLCGDKSGGTPCIALSSL